MHIQTQRLLRRVAGQRGKDFSYLSKEDLLSETISIPPAPVYNCVRLGINLTKYGVDVTKLAQDGKLDVLLGRDSEIQKLSQVLSRRRKNNPCLIGDSG